MDCRIHKDIEESLLEDLEGWGMDVEALRGSEGVSLSSPKVPRAFSTNVSNDLPSSQLQEEEWCSYAGMPSPTAYM